MEWDAVWQRRLLNVKLSPYFYAFVEGLTLVTPGGKVRSGVSGPLRSDGLRQHGSHAESSQRSAVL
jgi:hypothetical protein